MAVIANTYEIVRQIGSGGGGVVYEGRHLRLNKKIALKKDKRSLTASPEVLRQEVNTLKDLHHMYLPQVYDFLEEDGAVYTVMDYIEGESLDKLIERGEQISLPQVIEWSCELLEALAYIHSPSERHPNGILHSDIKPSNIMITPQNQIRLIDFNIALTLGEDNTVSVGRSHGYASPEHYGIDFSGSSGNETNTLRNRIFTRRKKEDMSPADSVTNSSLNGTTSSSRVITTSDGKTIKLDKRSDIYGVGATLYHLLTGIRPEKADHTDQIEPITNFAVNEMIAKIVQKAMDPNPDRRYQTAEEMLYALEHIRDGDRQTKSHRRHILETAVLIAVLLVCGAGMTFIGQQQKQRVSYYKECVTDSVEALRMGDKKTALKLALLTFPENPGLYDPPEPLPEAELALSNALGIYDLQSSYKPWRTISLSSEPMKLRMSPDCTKIAFQVRESDAWTVNVFDLERGEALFRQEMEPAALSEILFYDDNTLLFAGRNGISSCNLTTGELNWSTGYRLSGFDGFDAIGELVWNSQQSASGCLALSQDKTVIATVYMDASGNDCICLFNALNGMQIRQPVPFIGKKINRPVSSLGDSRVTMFALDEHAARLAVSFDDGSFAVMYLEDNTHLASPPSDYTYFDGCFCGEYLAVSCYRQNPDSTLFTIYYSPTMSVMYGPHTGTEGHRERYLVSTDGAAFYLTNWLQTAKIDMNAKTSEIIAGMASDSTSSGRDMSISRIIGFHHNGNRTVVWTGESEYKIFNEYAQCLETGKANDSGSMIRRAAIGGDFLVLGNDGDNFLLIRKLDDYKPFFEYASCSHEETRLRSDGNAAVLFGHGGFRIVTADKSVVNETVWDETQIFDPQFRRVGTTDFLGRTVTEETLEVLYENGTVEGYSVTDGSLLYQEQIQAPDSQYRNTYHTKDYRVTWITGQPPEIYQSGTDTLLKTLDSITRPSYATQIGDHLIIQYTVVNPTEQTYSAVMLDKNLEEVAELPNLSDILPDGTLVFDDYFGNLRQSRIYSIDELITMAKQEVQ